MSTRVHTQKMPQPPLRVTTCANSGDSLSRLIEFVAAFFMDRRAMKTHVRNIERGKWVINIPQAHIVEGRLTYINKLHNF